MEFQLVDIVESKNTLGEGVLWDDVGQAFWWTDIQERILLRYDLSSRRLHCFETPERAGSFGLTDRPGWLIVAFESGFALFEPKTGALNWLARPEKPDQGRRFNDGRVDRQGHFWAGTMVEDETLAASDSAALYRLSDEGSAQIMERGVQIANGLCWSPDSARLYFADSPKKIIYAFDFDASNGALKNRQVFATTSGNADPDGSDVDAQGFVWNAQWGSGRVVRYHPGGEINCTLDLPTSQPTCIAFGGRGLNLLAITTAGEGLCDATLGREEQAGNLLIYATDVTGLQTTRYICPGQLNPREAS